jgi:hypothetical protein
MLQHQVKSPRHLLDIGAPVAAGTSLCMQGPPGSLTDVVTRKAAQNPVSWLPSV